MVQRKYVSNSGKWLLPWTPAWCIWQWNSLSTQTFGPRLIYYEPSVPSPLCGQWGRWHFLSIIRTEHVLHVFGQLPSFQMLPPRAAPLFENLWRGSYSFNTETITMSFQHSYCFCFLWFIYLFILFSFNGANIKAQIHIVLKIETIF